MKLIPLRDRAGIVIAEAIVDDDDFDRFGHKRWHRNSRGYAVRNNPRGVRPGTPLLHREILGLGAGNKLEVDHIDRDRLNDQKFNLRIVPAGTNAQNVGSWRRGTSIHRGVSWSTTYSCWEAHVGVNRKQYNLGLFTDELEAARVAADFRKKHLPYSVL